MLFFLFLFKFFPQFSRHSTHIHPLCPLSGVEVLQGREEKECFPHNAITIMILINNLYAFHHHRTEKDTMFASLGVSGWKTRTGKRGVHSWHHSVMYVCASERERESYGNNVHGSYSETRVVQAHTNTHSHIE